MLASTAGRHSSATPTTAGWRSTTTRLSGSSGRSRSDTGRSRSDTGGERATAIYSLIGTATLNGFDPKVYLRGLSPRYPRPHRRPPRQTGRRFAALDLGQPHASSVRVAHRIPDAYQQRTFKPLRRLPRDRRFSSAPLISLLTITRCAGRQYDLGAFSGTVTRPSRRRLRKLDKTVWWWRNRPSRSDVLQLVPPEHQAHRNPGHRRDLLTLDHRGFFPRQAGANADSSRAIWLFVLMWAKATTPTVTKSVHSGPNPKHRS